MSYIDIIKAACLFFPVLAFIITIPFILRQYHKYGSIPLLRVIIVYSFSLYLLIAYFLIILPLPTITEVSNMTGTMFNLIPFSFITDISSATSIFSPKVYTVLFNLVLTMPFGVYLRYYFKQDLKHTILYSFLLTLFFEITQLTGLYFIYPRPYRLFDVDDLIVNTLGGILGYFLTKLFTFFLPSRDELDSISYEKGKKVSFIRRVVAYSIDLIFICLLWIIVEIPLKMFNLDNVSNYSFLIVFFIYYPIYMSIKKGQTIGKKIVNIKVVRTNDKQAAIYNYFFRYLILYTLLMVLPTSLFVLLMNLFSSLEIVTFLFVSCFLVIILFMIFLYIVINNIMGRKLFIYERISRTKNISTINTNNEEEQLDDVKKEKLDDVNEEIVLL